MHYDRQMCLWITKCWKLRGTLTEKGAAAGRNGQMRERKTSSTSSGQSERVPAGPIQSLNPLHHAVLVSDPWQHMEANAGHQSFWAASCLSAPENLSAQQDVSLCAHHPPAPGPLLLAWPKVHSLGLKSRIWSGEGLKLTTAVSYCCIWIMEEKKYENTVNTASSHTGGHVTSRIKTDSHTTASQLAQPQWPREAADASRATVNAQ